jgi:hypothetical protein
MKPIFWLGCYRCIFQGTWNSAQLQNFGGGGGFTPPHRYATGDTWVRSTRRGLNLSSTNLPRPWSPWESSASRKNPHGRTSNWTRDVMINSQKHWPLDHEAGHISWNVLFVIWHVLWLSWIMVILNIFLFSTTVHVHPMYLVCTNLHCVIGETSYGIPVGCIELDQVFTTFWFIYLCIYIFKSEVQSLLLSS